MWAYGMLECDKVRLCGVGGVEKEEGGRGISSYHSQILGYCLVGCKEEGKSRD
jgi:hypothetical protein